MGTPLEELIPHMHTERPYRTLWITGRYQTVEQVNEASNAELLEVRNLGPTMLEEIRKAVRLALEPPVHRAQRGSDVEAWLKRWRDRYEPGDPGYFTLDNALNDYREHADCGVPLNQEAPGPHPEED